MWFEFPSHYVFHYVNSWEEQNDAGQTIITLWGAALDDVNLDFYDEHPFHAREDKGFISRLSKMTFNMSTGKTSIEQSFLEKSVEFPVVSQDLIGYKTKYAYMSYQADKTPESQAGQDSLFFQGFLKFDLQEGKLVKCIDFGENKTAGEVFFQARENSQSEDDGYLMSFVFDWSTNSSEIVIWDAKTMSDEPILRAPTKARVPHGFHSFFVPEDDLE